MPQRMTLRATPKMLKAASIEPEPPPPAPPPLPARPRKPDTADRAGKAAPSSRRPNRHETNLRITALLRRRFPEAFTEPRPLAVGIYREIRDVIGRDELSSRDL